MSRHVNVTIAALAAVAVVVMFESSGEPVIPVLRGTSVEPLLLGLGSANSIAFNLSVGYLVSALFWLLVVFIPERSRKRLLRDNLNRAYQAFKESVLQILLWSSIGTHDSRLPEELCDHRKFKEFFGAEESTRWYAAMNGLQGSELRMHELLLELEIFAEEVAYVLNSVSIEDEKVHRLFKVLKENIYRLNHWNADTYEHVKSLGRFLWGIFARWDFVDGQRETDVVQETIDRL
jgi:hypothetical protein